MPPSKSWGLMSRGQSRARPRPFDYEFCHAPFANAPLTVSISCPVAPKCANSFRSFLRCLLVLIAQTTFVDHVWTFVACQPTLYCGFSKSALIASASFFVGHAWIPSFCHPEALRRKCTIRLTCMALAAWPSKCLSPTIPPRRYAGTA